MLLPRLDVGSSALPTELVALLGELAKNPISKESPVASTDALSANISSYNHPSCDAPLDLSKSSGIRESAAQSSRLPEEQSCQEASEPTPSYASPKVMEDDNACPSEESSDHELVIDFDGDQSAEVATSEECPKSGLLPQLPPLASLESSKGGDKERSMLKCPFCSYHTPKRNGIKHHVTIHSDHQSFGCFFCPYRSKWKYSVVRHMLYFCRSTKRITPLPSLVDRASYIKFFPPPPGDILCDYLKDEFNSDSFVLGLEAAKKSDSTRGADGTDLDQKPSSVTTVQCRHCPHRAPRWRMKEHVVAHSNFRLYGCSLCDFRAKRRLSVERHLSTCLSACDLRSLTPRERGLLVKFFQPPPEDILYEFYPKSC